MVTAASISLFAALIALNGEEPVPRFQVKSIFEPGIAGVVFVNFVLVFSQGFSTSKLGLGGA